MWIADDALTTSSVEVGEIHIKVSFPELQPNDHYGSEFEVRTKKMCKRGCMYGASALQATIYSMIEVVDIVSAICEENSARVLSPIWNELRRMKTPDEEWEVLEKEYARQHGLQWPPKKG